MRKLALGRLFWKFLIFFFLAQMTTVLGIGLGVWATKPEFEKNFPPPPLPLPFNAGPFPRNFPPPPPNFQPQLNPGPPVVHLLAGTVVSLIFAALLAAYVSRPIHRLRLALREGASGQLTPGLSAAMGNRRDELADLGQDFDRMVHHVALLMEGQRRLLHDVSHELRSPLARLNAVIGLIRQQPESLEANLSRLEHESLRMNRLLSELLRLSRLESGMVERINEPVELAELLADVVADAEPEIGQAACRVDLDNRQSAQVCGDPEMLHRVFDNLLRNALTHAASGQWVGIRLTTESGDVCVRFEDRGPGVLSSEIERIFIPFYRGGHSSGNNGYGLGLAIAQQIVENHGGRIKASNRPEGGLCVSVSLPGVKACD